jgi:hypothetical protein
MGISRESISINEVGPWILIFGAIGSLLLIHLWPWIYRQLNPLEFYLEPDIATGILGLQSFPNGPIHIQVRVRTRIKLTSCRAWILFIEYKPDQGIFKPEHNERFPCQWSWAGTEDHSTIDLNTTVPCAFNVATVGDGQLFFQPVMPTNIHDLIKREGIHRFTLNVTGHSNNKEKSLTRKLNVEWRGAKQLPVLTFEDE